MAMNPNERISRLERELEQLCQRVAALEPQPVIEQEAPTPEPPAVDEVSDDDDDDEEYSSSD